MKYTNAGLCNALLNGDSRAIDTISAFIRPIVEAEISNYEDREDIRQYCFIEILEYLRRSDEVTNIWALARRISINSVIDFKKHTRRSSRIIHSTIEGTTPDASGADVTNTIGTLRNIAARDQLHYILKSISKKCLEIFVTIFVEDQSYTEASIQLGITEGNLRVRLSRCRDKAVAIRKKVFGY